MDGHFFTCHLSVSQDGGVLVWLVLARKKQNKILKRYYSVLLLDRMRKHLGTNFKTKQNKTKQNKTKQNKNNEEKKKGGYRQVYCELC